MAWIYIHNTHLSEHGRSGRRYFAFVTKRTVERDAPLHTRHTTRVTAATVSKYQKNEAVSSAFAIAQKKPRDGCSHAVTSLNVVHLVGGGQDNGSP